MGTRTTLRAAREARGWSQAKLAKEANASQTAISRLENGIGEGLGRTLQGVCRALGLTPEEVLREDDESTPAEASL
jgi:transcriptional regulator with XRE-family HTH domain